MLTKKTAAVIFLTGLSGAGKTTIANALQQKLLSEAIEPEMLDGDEIRKTIQLTAFDEESRKKHNLNVGSLASQFELQGKLVIVSVIAPYADVRKQIRNMCLYFIEVYVSTDLQTCIKRDPKGLYKKAINGELKDFTGISAPYEIPQHPELILDTALLSVDESVERIYSALKQLQ